MSVFTLWPEEIQWRRVSLRLFWIEAGRVLGRLVVVLTAATLAWYFTDLGRLAEIVAAGAAALALLRLVLLPRNIRSWGYAERADNLLVRHGLFYRRLSIVPYGRMQFIDVTAGPFERLLGLSTVQLHTAAAATDARIPGLRPAEAARLRDHLASLGESRAEGL